MSRTYHHGKNRRIRVQGVRRPTDLKRLARALIDLEAAKAEAEAEQDHTHAKREDGGQKRRAS
jgi:hypothetical protein